MNFKVSSYLYLHHDEHKLENIIIEAIEILNSAFNQYKILKIEERKENNETAISFETYIQAGTEELAEKFFLSSLKKYDVDNYCFFQE